MCALTISGTQPLCATCSLGAAVATVGAVSVVVSVGVAVLADSTLCHSFCSSSELTVLCLTVVALDNCGHCHPVLTAFLSVVDPTHISAPADAVALLPSLIAAPARHF